MPPLTGHIRDVKVACAAMAPSVLSSVSADRPGFPSRGDRLPAFGLRPLPPFLSMQSFDGGMGSSMMFCAACQPAPQVPIFARSSLKPKASGRRDDCQRLLSRPVRAPAHRCGYEGVRQGRTFRRDGKGRAWPRPPRQASSHILAMRPSAQLPIPAQSPSSIRDRKIRSSD